MNANEIEVKLSILEKKCLLLTCDSPKITTLKTNNHSSKEVDTHTIWCGLPLYCVIVGVW